jgi:outer membrane protein assembly factor BamB
VRNQILPRLVPRLAANPRPGTCVRLAAALFLLAAPRLLSAESSGEAALPDTFAPQQLLWSLELGSHQYTVPRIDRGRVYLGVNDLGIDHPAVKSTGGGILMSVDQATGQRIWQLPVPRNMAGKNPPFHFNHWKCGVCSRPAIDGDRLFIVGPRGDVLCLDREGQADGNDGPFQDEVAYMGIADDIQYTLAESDGDILWRFDMIESCGVVPHDVCGSSPAVHGDYLYVCTSNGVDDKHRLVANPDAPSLIVLDKTTGRLVATDGNRIGEKTLHGQWSSPVVGQIRGRSIVFFGGGDGVLYAFEPIVSTDPQDGVRSLDLIWQHDCCPPDYRERDGEPIPYGRWNKNRDDGPSEIIATPIIDGDRVFASIGQSPVHGPGQGMLSCIDGATGETIWETREVMRTLSDVTIHEGLVYSADYSGRLQCLDAETGRVIWRHELDSGVWCASPVVADGKVYISTEKQKLWVFRAGREPQVLSESRLHSMGITPVVQDGFFCLPTQRRFFALQLP